MAFVDPDYVAGILDDVLQAGATALAAAGRPIDRVCRFPGTPSWDCEMLSAWPSLRIGGFETNASSTAMRRQIKHVLDINVSLLRCTTTMTATGIPKAPVVDNDGLAFAEDMWTLQRAYSLGIIQGTLFSTATCTVGRMGPFVPQTPQGGLSGMTTTIEVAL